MRTGRVVSEATDGVVRDAAWDSAVERRGGAATGGELPGVRESKPPAERRGDRQRHLRLPAHEVEETAAGESEHIGIAVRSDGRRARLAGEQAHLPERRAGPQGVDAPVLATIVGGDVDAEHAARDEIEGVGGVALADHDSAVGDRGRLQVRGELRERHTVEPGEELDAGQKLGVFARSVGHLW